MFASCAFCVLVAEASGHPGWHQMLGHAISILRVRNEHKSNKEISNLKIFIAATMFNFDLRHFPEQQLNLTLMIYKGPHCPLATTDL